MSSFNNIGRRESHSMTNKKTKAHVKAFYKIMDDMETISQKLDPSIEYTEDNINDYVKPIYRALDPMEMFLVLGKLNNIKENGRKEDNAK